MQGIRSAWSLFVGEPCDKQIGTYQCTCLHLWHTVVVESLSYKLGSPWFESHP